MASSISYEERDPKATRKELAAARDVVIEEQSVVHESDESMDSGRAIEDPVVRVTTAIKSMQILGQILKNFPGSLEAGSKIEIARACYTLGLQSASYLFRMLRDTEKEVVKFIVDFVRQYHPHLDNVEISRKAQDTIFGLVRMTTFGIIWRISSALSSSELLNTYERLEREIGTPAVKLVNLSIQLSHAEPFPHNLVIRVSKELDGNHLATWSLKSMIVHHFSIFKVDYRTMQVICQKLNIEYKRITALDPRQKMLKS